MASRDLDAVFYVKNVPDIRFEDGHFHVSYDVGQRARFEFVFSPSTFIKMRKIAGTIVDEFEEGKHGKVVGMRKAKVNGAH
jgi:hypothetical protein